MTANEFMVGHVTKRSLRFVQDNGNVLSVEKVEMTERDWDVTDPQARYEAALEEYPALKDLGPHCAQMFIDEDRNAAALCVYRPTDTKT